MGASNERTKGSGANVEAPHVHGSSKLLAVVVT